MNKKNTKGYNTLEDERAKDLYEIVDTVDVGGVRWCWVRWCGWYKDPEEYKTMMRKLFDEMAEDCKYSHDTKRWYVKRRSLPEFEKIIVEYAENLTLTSAKVEVAKKLDRLFGSGHEETKNGGSKK